MMILCAMGLFSCITSGFGDCLSRIRGNAIEVGSISSLVDASLVGYPIKCKTCSDFKR